MNIFLYNSWEVQFSGTGGHSREAVSPNEELRNKNVGGASMWFCSDNLANCDIEGNIH
jgi:hypothetical protein